MEKAVLLTAVNCCLYYVLKSSRSFSLGDIEAKNIINESFGAVNFFINGAGGNNPRVSMDNEMMTPDLDGIKDFFALEESGLKFVFDLNIISAFLVGLYCDSTEKTHSAVHFNVLPLVFDILN